MPPVIIGAAIVFGLVCGCFEITNTSIGWHIASGRWMLSEREILDHDVLSYTSGGAEWIDHEWLSGVVFYEISRVGGGQALLYFSLLLMFFTVALIVGAHRNARAAFGGRE